MNLNTLLRYLAGVGLAVGCTQWAAANTLFDYYTLAEAQNPAFAAAQARARAGREKEPQSRARLLPAVSVVAGTGWVDHRDEGVVEHDRNNANAYALVLTQPLFRWQDVIAHEQGTLSSSAAQIELSAARQSLILKVAQVYFDVVLAQQALAAAQHHAGLAQAQFHDVAQARHQGSATGQQAEAVQAQADLAVAQALDAEDALTLANEAFQHVTGQRPQKLPGAAEHALFQAPVPASIDAWAGSARDANLQVQAAQLKLLIAEKNVDKQNAEHLPTVDLVAAYGRFDAGGGTLVGAPLSSRNYDQAAVGLKVSLPLYAGGGTSSRVREATALRESQGYDLADQRRSAEVAARRAYLQVTGAQARFQALSHALKSEVASCRAIRNTFREGAAVGNDVLEAQDRVDGVSLKLARLRHDVAMAQLNLLAAAGQLAPADLQRFEEVEGVASEDGCIAAK